jgi:hypothetical protein
MACVVAFVGLLHDSNSLVFYEGFVAGLLSGLLLTGLGIGLVVFRLKGRTPVTKEVLLTVIAGAPIIYAVVKRWF